jgi:phage terminase small subunit
MSQLQLSPRQSEFVAGLLRGLDVPTAGIKAGYTETSAWTAVRHPLVAGALHQAIAVDIVSIAAPAAFHVAKRLMLDDKVAAGIRADIAFKFMDRAGHITPSNKQKAPQKALSEMSREEMLDYIDRNTKEIEKIELELAERATDVSAPVSPQNLKTLDAKPLNYLD